MSGNRIHQQSVRFPKDVAAAIREFREVDRRPTFQNAMEALILKGAAAYRSEKASQSKSAR